MTAPARTTIDPALVSISTATAARRVIAVRRPNEKRELPSWMAPRAAARSVASCNRGRAIATNADKTTITTHNSTRVVPLRVSVEADERIFE